MRTGATDVISSGLATRDRAIRRLFLARSAAKFERAATEYLGTYFPQHVCLFIFMPAAAVRAYVPILCREKRIFRDGLSSDLWFSRRPPKPGLKIIRHSDHTGPRDLADSQFLREFLQPRDLSFGLTLCFWGELEFLGCLTLMRPLNMGDYCDIELAHVRQAYLLIDAAVRNLAEMFAVQGDLTALSRAGFLVMDGHALTRKSGKIVAAGKQAYSIIKSWPDTGVTQKLGPLPEEMPASLIRWVESPNAVRPHPRWHVEKQSLGAPINKHLMLRFSDGVRPRSEAGWHRLTGAERDLVAGIVRGKTNREMAAARRTSPITVKNQVERLLKKTGAKSRVELAVFFARRLRYR